MQGKTFYEMTEIIDNNNGRLIPVTLEAPPDIYKNPQQKKRIEFLKISELSLSFTNYNTEKQGTGFYATVPLVPIVDKNVRRISKINKNPPIEMLNLVQTISRLFFYYLTA